VIGESLCIMLSLSLCKYQVAIPLDNYSCTNNAKSHGNWDRNPCEVDTLECFINVSYPDAKYASYR